MENVPLLTENIRLSCENAQVPLSVRRFRIEEAMNGLFRIQVWAVSPLESLDLGSFVGHRAEVALSGTRERLWRGLCTEMALCRISDDGEGLATYELMVAPTAWRLTQRRDNRLFQHMSIPEIVHQILDDHGILHVFQITPDDYPKLELRTQYNETDYAFVSRLLEEAGISFWFEDEGERDATLVLGDAPQSNPPRSGSPIAFVDQVFQAQAGQKEHVTRVELRERSRPGKITLRDYDFWRPKRALFATSQSDRLEEQTHEQYHHSPGAFLREVAGPSRPSVGAGLSAAAAAVSHVHPAGALFAAASAAASSTDTPVADDLAVARFVDELGSFTANRMMEALHADRRTVSFETSVNDLSPGCVFRVVGHPRDDVSAAAGLLVTAAVFEGEVAASTAFRFAATAVLADRPYRAPRSTPKPRIYGLQSAVVVAGGTATGLGQALGAVTQAVSAAANVLPGALGEVASAVAAAGAAASHLANQEIYVDERGRVRVQFPWDRLGHQDARSSIWMRVSQGWAGSGYGLFTIPRVGQEVLVAFVDGDPDCPIIVGRVHNVLEPTPFKLPENKTVSTWKTSSSPGGGGFNELRFDDAAGREHVYLQAQKDMDHLAKNDLKQAVGRDRSGYVQRDDAVAVGRDKTEIVNQNQIDATGLNRAQVVGVNRTATVGVEDSTLVGSRWSVTIARGLTRTLAQKLDEVAGSVGGVMRSVATGVLGFIPSDPLAKAAEASLASFGSAAFGKLKTTLASASMEAGPPPTCIEMVDRQIKLSTGEASIVLDGPNISFTAQGTISMHSMKSASILAEEEIAVAGREKVAVVSATDDLILQAGKNLHLNPFDASDSMPEAARLEGDPAGDMFRCHECGEKLTEGPEGWYCPNDPISQTPAD